MIKNLQIFAICVQIINLFTLKSVHYGILIALNTCRAYYYLICVKLKDGDVLAMSGDPWRWGYLSSQCLLIKLTFILGLVWLLLLGSQITTKGSGVGKTPRLIITLTRADSGKTIALHTNDSLVIRLAENPTTGYRWAIDMSEMQIIALQADASEADPSGAVGGSGQRVFRFKAIRAGSDTLHLKYWRGWEGAGSIIERFSVTVQVREANN